MGGAKRREQWILVMGARAVTASAHVDPLCSDLQ